jgi:hypothetical protein
MEQQMSHLQFIQKVARRSCALAIATALSATAIAQSASINTTALHFEGRSSNWFDANNWREGRVPGANDDVILDRGDVVVIDPANGQAQLEIRDLYVGDGAQLTTLPGTILSLRDEHIGAARILHRSSGVFGDGHYFSNANTGVACAECGVELSNPSPKSKRIIVLQSSHTAEMGLGGIDAAMIARDASGGLRLAAGPGYYATTTAHTLLLDGHLWLNLYYGFSPIVGDSFQLFSAERFARGQFVGLPESALVGCTSNGVGLRISYVGGDGNDVVLRAEQAEIKECAEPSVQLIGPELPPGTDAVREHILLARQVGVP